MLITVTTLAGVLKIVGSFLTSLELYMVVKFVDAAMCSSIFPCAYVLLMENVSTNHRILVSAITLLFNTSGQVLLGVIAMYTRDFELLLRIIGSAGLLAIPCGLLLNESLRWLLVNRRLEEAVACVENAAKVNGIKVPPSTYDVIAEKCNEAAESSETSDHRSDGIRHIFRSQTLSIRLTAIAFCWIVVTLLSYGISIFSVSLPGDKYVNFITASAGNAPGVILYYFLLTHVKRRPAFSMSLIVTGLMVLASKYVSSELLSLMLFFGAKSFTQHASGSIYIYTTEMWPTSCRHSILGLCSMFGRIGLLLANAMPYTVIPADQGLFSHSFRSFLRSISRRCTATSLRS